MFKFIVSNNDALSLVFVKFELTFSNKEIASKNIYGEPTRIRVFELNYNEMVVEGVT